MAIKNYQPTSPGRRFRTGLTFDEVTKAEPQKGLLLPLGRSGGRNNTGRITSDHRGGGHRRLYRLVDFKRDKKGIPAKVEAIEYDPNRSARIALLCYADGERRYILAPDQLRVGDSVISGDDKVDIQPGNSLPLRFIPVGTIRKGIMLFLNFPLASCEMCSQNVAPLWGRSAIWSRKISLSERRAGCVG